jgi:hypothetical protein
MPKQQNTKRITRKAINKAIRGLNLNGEIHHGGGYWYFTGPSFEYARQTGVYVYRLSALSLFQWTAEACRFANESRNNNPNL